jgi:hypothetical protein
MAATPSLRERWANVGAIFADPRVLVLEVITVLSLVGASLSESKSLSVVLSSVGAISAGICSNIATKIWLDLSEKSLLTTKGKSAIRSLKLLEELIVDLQARVEIYVSRLDFPEFGSPAIARTNLEEIIDKCKVLQKETVSSIENWVDIVPDAVVAGLVAPLIRQLTEVKEELVRKTAERDTLVTDPEATSGTIKNLEKMDQELSLLWRRYVETSRELAKREQNIDAKVLESPEDTYRVTCSNCKGSFDLYHVDAANNSCPRCGHSPVVTDWKSWLKSRAFKLVPVQDGQYKISRRPIEGLDSDDPKLPPEG